MGRDFDAFRFADEHVALIWKSGKALTRFFPEVAAVALSVRRQRL
jgi:hypothetical protein